ncbi:metal-dependent hydrolase [Halobellus rarus]|uniref:Metal-dependent hydrolase n=1 Tax=Halobellus rarus TaxID=1126237 RepID=A0ABD6CJW2_9EURY|nr:metal-dependent hydrolase [Halobellus rarus]
MLPWGHLALGYLVYTLGTRLWNRRAPGGAPTLVLAFGTQFPDLFDKPLNWWFNIFDGRAIGHSVITTVVICVLLFVAARKYGHRDLVGAFSIGVFTHLLGDSWNVLLSGSYGRASFLLWPLLSPPTYPKDSLLDHLREWLGFFQTVPGSSPRLLVETQFGLQLVLFALLIGVWAFDGFPGPRTLWNLITSQRSVTD